MLGHTLVPTSVPNKKDDKLEYEIIDGYEFDRVENGKIIFMPTKSKYPTNYQECCQVLGLPMQNALEYINTECYKDYYYKDLINTLDIFTSLKICRDAYCKIAGEEMGLGKHWKPDWKDSSQQKFTIFYYQDEASLSKGPNVNRFLSFPTEEIRDTFYKNFKELIKECKELV